MKDNRCLITREMVNLVVRSECINRYPEIKRILEKHQATRGIYKKDIAEESMETINIIENAFHVILEEAKNEWTESGYKGRNKTKCQLCNNPNIKDNFEITNEENNVKMIVGSSCIGKFNIKLTTKNARELINASKKVERLTKINVEYPNISERIHSLKIFYKDLPTILPIELDEKFNTYRREIQDFYNKYTELELPDKSLPELGGHIERCEQIKKEIDEFIKNAGNGRLSIDVKLKRWLNEKDKKEIKLKIMRQGGIINIDTIHQVYQKDFVLRFKEEIETLLESRNFIFKDVDEGENITFTYKYQKQTIDFNISTKKFMEKFGAGLLGGFSEDDENNLLKEIELTNNNNNIDKIERLINYTILADSRYHINEYKSSPRYVRLERDGKDDIDLDRAIFFRVIKPLLFINQSEAKTKLIEYCNRLTSWKNKEKYS